MTTPVVSVTRQTSVPNALRLLARHHITSAPVVDEEERVVGIISEIDLLRPGLEPDPRAHVLHVREPTAEAPSLVGDVMTPDPHVVHEDADVADVARTFALMSWKAVPVVREGRLAGMVSRSDVVRAMARRDDEIVADVERLFAELGRPTWHASATGGVVEVSGTFGEQERELAGSIARSVAGVRRVHFIGVHW